MNYKHLFGPVISRRLGVSLGIDLVPFKVCPLDCVYCEVGATTSLTLERKEYVSYEEVVSELNDYIAHNPKLDYITFSGSGEPVLFCRISELSGYIRKSYPQYKLALITNSILLINNDIADSLTNLDLIMPSLDAVSETCFHKINRPVVGVLASEVVEALVRFRSIFKGQMWLEVFIIPGINDNTEELSLLSAAVKRIKPDRVQINSLDRPGTEAWVQALDRDSLENIKILFESTLKEDGILVEIIARVRTDIQYKNFNPDVIEQVLALIRRRPCTNHDLALTLALHINEVNKLLHSLIESHTIEAVQEERGTFYRIKG
jgi:wyosine [tRNA(Phe)-imidazoG37] synthetase (radical SAM superfamily)